MKDKITLSDNEFAVATGNVLDLVKLAKALECMFDFEFTVCNGEKIAINKLIARDVQSNISNKRRDGVLKVANYFIDKYNLPCVLSVYDGFVMPQSFDLDIKAYTFEDAVNNFDFDDIFEVNSLKENEFGYLINEGTLPTRENFARQFEFIYEKTPTTKQLDIFIAFMLGNETDVDKVRSICDGNDQNTEEQNQSEPSNI